ncbi:hypothetical protein BLNAU_8239 [Blattamonas nauphoetae]|uniref:Uncharacterized protein n=1 Tax=Blattamonas nauphoetae TaxID=2049346 RepID=A0ABQ9XZ87_9EUKA|nr:hypothetical protein BLNAU_8239 [Blattamonas nauphoetae]
MPAHEIALPTITVSDWRLVLQDSISQEALQEGCLSLFDQIDTDLPLSQAEMSHAARFLEYATLHVEYRRYPHNKLLKPLLYEELCGQRNVTSALVKLVCHPSDTLQTIALSFLDAAVTNSFANKFYSAVAETELIPQLIKTLKPHEIPLNGKTIKFHRHITSILDHFFDCSSSKDHSLCLPSSILYSRPKPLLSQKFIPLFNSSLTYLRSLAAAPVCPPDPRSGFAVLSDMTLIDQIKLHDVFWSHNPGIQRFLTEIRSDIVKELTSILGFPSTKEAELCLRSDSSNLKKVELWLKGFEYLLGRVSEGTQFSDFGTLAVAFFLSLGPVSLRFIFDSDDKFDIKMCGRIVSSSKLDIKLLWTLFTPTQPQHAATVLTAFNRFMNHVTSLTVEKHIWSGWFPSFVNAVDPSKLPFTADYIPFHEQLIDMLNDHVSKIRQYEDPRKHESTDQLRSELDETYHAFYTHTKEYVVHLSLHPFALDEKNSDEILFFLRQWYLDDLEDSLNKPYRSEVRKAMDACALSTSSPPFILTSEGTTITHQANRLKPIKSHFFLRHKSFRLCHL